MGTIHVYDTAGAACGNVQWRKAKHDEWNSGLYGKDTLRPGAISDLAVTVVGTDDVRLEFTAVGDDGKCGTATSYELRASASPITEATFAAATPVGLAAPAPSGTAEVRVATLPAGMPHLALRAVDEAGNAGPIATGAAVGTIEVRKVVLRLRGGGQDALAVKARTALRLADLGLPGADVTITLTDGGGQRYTSTIPAALLVSNAAGTRIKFRDPTGTQANGLIRFKAGGTYRTDVKAVARIIDLTGAGPGPLTVHCQLGPTPLDGTVTLRASGSTFRYP
jgi:hypothetical protein